MKINAGHFKRIPARYSDDLERVIRWMMAPRQSRRPSIEDLEHGVPRLRPWIRETKLNVREISLNQKVCY